MSKLKVTELFSGIGSQVAALKRLGIDYECVGISEIDKYAIKSYEAINGPTHNYGDISKIDRLDYTDLLIYSSPCFPRGSMVLTDAGYKDIADIQVGDKVLTHLGNWKPVVRVMNNGIKDLVKLTFNDGAVIRCTPNHKFLCTNEAFDCENVGEWVEAKDIGENYPIWIKNGKKGHGWVTSYEKDEKEEVFDIEVEDDHSFTVSNYAVHNCTDFSLAGKQSGLFDKDGKQTRSGLLLEVGRLLMKMSDEKILPKYLLMENVKNLVGKKFKPAFDIWLQALEAIGYNNYWKVLNAKDYGVPQNRERVFVVSIRKDVDTNGYTFPEPFKLERRLKDVLETNVDEKFYLKQELVDNFIERLAKREVSNTIRCGGAGSIDQKHTWDLVAEPSIIQNPHGYNNGGIIKDNVAPTMTSNGYYHLNNFVCNEPLIAASRGRNPDNPLSREAGLPTEQQLEINRTGCSNTLTTVGKDNLVVEPNVLVQKRTDYGKQIRKDYEAGLIKEHRYNMVEYAPRTDGVSNTLATVQKDNYVYEPKIDVLGNYKPSGHECGRVMGVEGVASTIKDNHSAVYSIAEPQIKHLGNVFPTKTRDNPNQGRVYDETGLPPALNCMGGDNREPCVVEPIKACVNGTARTIKAQYFKNSLANFTRQDGLGATAVITMDHGNSEPKEQFFRQAIEPFKQNECNAGDTIDAFNKRINGSGCSPTLATQPEGFKTSILRIVNQENNTTEQISTQDIKSSLRIRKLTPKECWRLMDFTDEEFENAAYEKEFFYLEGDKEKCDANLRVVKEKQNPKNTGTYALCTINDSSDTEILKTIKKLLAETPESERMQNVNFVITKLADAEPLECATNITKCITFMGMRCILMEEKDRQVTVIIAQEKGGKENIAKFMKITIKSNLTPLKLYTILILIAQIMRLGICGSSILQVSIQGAIAITGDCENSILLKISNLKMENMYTRVSSSQLYRQAGNSIVVSCLAHIFRELLKGTEYEPEEGFKTDWLKRLKGK